MADVNIHVCLVSGQPTPNVTPVLDERVRPRKVVLLVSKDMEERAKWLNDVLSSHKVIVQERFLNSNPWDVEQLREELLSIVTELRSDDIALNVTGGTKPMAIAAYEVFRTFDLPVFYVHPERDRLIWLYPKKPAIDLENRIRVGNFLAVHGYRVVSTPNRASVPEPWRTLTSHLVNGIDRYGKPMGYVNFLAATAERSLVSNALDPAKKNWRELNDLLELFEQHGFLSRQGVQLVFPDEEHRFFVNGGWLEYHVKSILDDLRPKFLIQDIAQDLEVCSAKSRQVKNEIDVAFLAENRLYIVECKTKRFDQQETVAGSETLYKLDFLREFGGLMSSCMLVSFRELPIHDQERAAAMKIRTVIGRGIQRLAKEITAWLSK